MDTLYIFLDEGGNFDFSKSGTSYFVFTAFSLKRPFVGIPELVDLKYDLWDRGLELEYFHAAEDRQIVRDNVFKIIGASLGNCRLDFHVVEKRKTHTALQHDHARFYHTIFDILLQYVLKKQKSSFSRVVVVADNIPVEKKKREIEKAAKLTLAAWSKKSGIPYLVMFHSAKSDLNLQITDYLNWAVYRKWERQDLRSYDLMRRFITSEFETFGIGSNVYY